MTHYFVRAEDATHFNVIMRDDAGFETIIDFARSEEVASRKVRRWIAKEAKAKAA